MPRPSKNLDKLLIQTGVNLLKEKGLSDFSIREVVEKSGVNLGMFHYHFKTKEIFSAQVLQELYDTVFYPNLVNSFEKKTDVLDKLKAALTTLGIFSSKHHKFVASLLNDLHAKNPVVLRFVSANLPRHANLIAGLVLQAQKEKKIIKAPLPTLLSYLMSAVAFPNLIGSLVEEIGPTKIKKISQTEILSQKAILSRVNFALRGVSI